MKKYLFSFVLIALIAVGALGAAGWMILRRRRADAP